MLAFAGMVGLSLAELNTARHGDLDLATANAGLIAASYGITTNAIGLGLVVAGVSVIRARIWSGWRRWMALVCGVATFVELTPGMFGGFVIARLAIAVWMLLLAALGAAMIAEGRAAAE